MTITFIGSPLDATVCFELDINPRNKLHATTTSAITLADIKLRPGRAAMLRKLYENGSTSEHLVQRLYHRPTRGAEGRHDAGQHADKERQEETLYDHRCRDD